jgi:hypothetical protein
MPHLTVERIDEKLAAPGEPSPHFGRPTTPADASAEIILVDESGSVNGVQWVGRGVLRAGYCRGAPAFTHASHLLYMVPVGPFRK